MADTVSNLADFLDDMMDGRSVSPQKQQPSPPPRNPSPPGDDSDSDFLLSPCSKKGKVNEPPTKKRHPRTKATEKEKLNAARTAKKTSRKVPFGDGEEEAEDVDDSSSAAASRPAKRQRTKVINYNETALSKADAKAKKAAYLAELTRHAKENRMRKGDYEVKAIEGLKFCRQAGCKYCRDYKCRMPLWLVSYVGYGPEGNTYEHWDKLDCPELVTAAFFIRAEIDPRDQRACMRYFNYGLVGSDDEDDDEPLEEDPEEMYANPQEYDWMRLGAPSGHRAPEAADMNDAQNVVITAVGKRGGKDEPYVGKDGVALEPIVLTPQNVTDLKADWALHRAVGKNRIATMLMDEHHWTPRIKPGGPLKGVKAQVSKQLTDLGICD